VRKKKADAWQSTNAGPPFSFGDRVVLGSISRLWTIGNRAILDQPLLGFFCSRQCPGDAIVRTYDLARGLRDAGIAVIGGFHSPMEKECLDLLLRGPQPIVICPAGSIEEMRFPSAWRRPIDDGRLLILSPFEANERRPTAALAEQRNHLVAVVASAVFIVHAARGSKIEQFCKGLREKGQPVWTFDNAENEALQQTGIRTFSVEEAVIQAARHCVIGKDKEEVRAKATGGPTS
jgi:predicted Rossmann fold nucleotide-binding protein DprA/Smf involved in DNA uptake